MGLKKKKDSEGDHTESAEADFNGTGRDADFSGLEDSEAESNVGDSTKVDSNELTKLTQELADTRDKYLRALADFENFKKRTQKERSELIRYQGEQILVDILEIVDGFERALEHATGDSSKLIEGLKLIHKQFLDSLGKWEVRPDSALGKEFDPNKHRAIAKSKGEKSGIIIGELKKAYLYRDKLLRVGEVVVSEAESPTESPTGEPAAETK